MIKLYGLDISGNTYKIKLLMSLLDVNYQFIALDISNKQHKSDSFLQLNPRGEFPVLIDDAFVIWDSQAILIYIARKYGAQLKDNHWYPDDIEKMTLITQWLTVANDEIFHTLARARSIIKFGHPGNLDLAQEQGKATLKWVEQHLSNKQWLATDKPSIADIACYPYIALCEEAGIPLKHYDAIQNWFKRLQQLKGYTSMPGI